MSILRARTAVLVFLAWTLVCTVPTYGTRTQQSGADRDELSGPRDALLHGRYDEAMRLLTPLADSDPTGAAALELGLLYRMLGQQSEAVRRLAPVVDPPSGSPAHLLRAARAARALGQFREANSMLREAAAAAASDPVINTAWGELFLEKYNQPDALRSFQAALRADPDHAPALVGVAGALLESNPPAARSAAEKALSIDAKNIPAMLLLAELALDDGKRQAAREHVAKALAINPHHLEARSVLAAIAWLEGRGADFQAEVERVLKTNPRYGEVFRVAADHAGRNYRFEEAAELAKRAIALDPDNSRAHADLGTHLLRTGDENAARLSLSRAFRIDPYDVVTYNLLGLFESLDKFETYKEGEITLRLHPEEAPVLREYAMPLAQEALQSMSARYGITPRGPILIEIFPKHDDFAVRNVGLPGMIGALGACFGRVVTLDSPRARPPGTFNWQATLWHEAAHVITLQMSNQRVARWLTEGISVYEEKLARPEWGRDMEVPFANALEKGEVLKLVDLNAGFQKPETISLAYYQASLLVEHIVATYGEQALHRILRAYGEGLETDAALEKGVGIRLEQMQSGFDQMLEKRFATLRRALKTPEALTTSSNVEELKPVAASHPDSYAVQLALGQALRAAGDLDGALAAFDRAATLVPVATGSDSAHMLLTETALEKGDKPRAMQQLAKLLTHDHTDAEAARRLAELASTAGDTKLARMAYERVVMLDPFDAAPHTALGRIALAEGDAMAAMREFRAALASGAVDRAAAHCDLGESYMVAGRVADAKREAIAALEIAPTFERAQDLLLKTAEVRQ